MLTVFERWIPASLKQRSLRRNVVLNWTAAILNAAVSLAITPVVVRTLEREDYGVWTFLNGLTIYANLLYLGLGAAFMKRMSEAVGREDVGGQSRLLGVAWTLYVGIGSVCLVLAVAMSPFVPSLLATPLAPATYGAATTTMALLGVRLLFMFVGSAFSALLSSHGRWDLVSGVIIAATVIRTAGVYWAMSWPSPIVALAVVMVLDGVLQIPALYLLCRLVAPDVRLRPVRPTGDELRGLYGFGLQAFVVQVALLVIGYTDTALIGVLLGAASVTMYALPLQLVEHSRVLVGGITQTLLPELAALRARGEFAQLKALFLMASRTCALLSAFINVHLVVLGPAFLTLWVGPAVAAESDSILLFLAMAATASALSTQVMTPFFQALDVLKLLVLVVLAEAAVNFALSVWLAGVLGIAGVAVATAVPAIAITMVLAPRYMLPRLSVSVREFAGHVLAPALVLAAICVLAQRALSLWLGLDSFALLAVRVLVSALAVLPVLALTFPREEWLPLVARVAPGLARRLS